MTDPLLRPFECTKCDKGFTRQENLKRHINTHHKGSSARNFPCNQCNARFARSDLRKRHIQNCHIPASVSPEAEQALLPPATPLVDSPTTAAWLEVLLHHPSAGPEPVPIPSLQQAQARPVPGEPLASPTSDLDCIEAFFDGFHKTFPILHEASFHVVSAQVPLLNAMTAVGSLYCRSSHDDASRKAMFESTLTSLQKYVEQNRSRYQETWVLQTFLLLEFLGIYGGDDMGFLRAQRIHRDLVDAMRMLQMSHDGSLEPGPGGESESTEDGGTAEQRPRDGESAEQGWQRCIYMLYLLDSQLAILCNLRPMLSSLEIKYDLPCSEDMWLAGSAEEWRARRRQQFKSFDDHDDQAYSHETPPSQGFFYEASQTLLHEAEAEGGDGSGDGNRDRQGLRLLWTSPFAAVILVTQLEMMARELTHASCLLERPKAQRRTLSVLTDKQHAQISQALRSIADLVPRSGHRAGQADSPLWHTFWMLWHYTSITLSHPDSLLVTGIVESNLPLAIATAGHLATPRSKDKRDIYEDRDVFRILNNLELALDLVSPSKATTVPRLENAFTTLLGFKICLVGWRLVRLTMVEARGASGNGNGNGNGNTSAARSNPCRFVLDAIMASIEGDGSRSSAEPDARPTEESEVSFLGWIVASFGERTVWPVGRWVAAVMEESLAKAVEALPRHV